jgi:competence protein ComEA
VEKFLTSSQNRVLLLLGIIGLILLVAGIFFFKSNLNFGGTKVEVLSESSGSDNPKNITAEIAGEVISPGVYKIPDGSRINDLLVAAGGFSGKADRVWTDKYLNRAARLTDGQKVYIRVLISSRVLQPLIMVEGIKLHHQLFHPIVMY